jgi:hypothetical protein
MDWLIYGGLVWVALIGFFWCLLAIAAGADRRDARKERRTARGPAPTGQPSAGRFASARDRLTRGGRRALNAREDTDQTLRRDAKSKR